MHDRCSIRDIGTSQTCAQKDERVGYITDIMTGLWNMSFTHIASHLLIPESPIATLDICECTIRQSRSWASITLTVRGTGS